MECLAYYSKVEPFGERRADMRAALVAAVFANANRGDHEPFTVEDFMLKFGPTAPAVVRQQTVEEQMAIFDMIRIQQDAIVQRQNAGS